MVKLLDDLSKNLAGGMTRRRALTAFAASVVGATTFWKKSGTAEALGVYTGDACFNFCYNLYADNSPVFNTCMARCVPLWNLNGRQSPICPPGTAPIRLDGAPTGRSNPSLNTYNPFPDSYSHAYIVCAPYAVNGSYINGIYCE